MYGVAENHPQTAYAGLQKSLHQEWAFVQRVTPDIGTAFQPVEDALRGAFLPALFKGSTSQIPVIEFTGLPVKHSGIAIPDPTQTAVAKWMAFCVTIGHLVAALRRTDEFWSGYHTLLMG